MKQILFNAIEVVITLVDMINNTNQVVPESVRKALVTALIAVNTDMP